MSIPTLSIDPDEVSGVVLDPETRACLTLWAAVFANGVQEAASHFKGERAVDARRWTESSDAGPGSFLWLCDLFNVPPAFVRARVLALSNKPTRRIRRK